MTTLAQVLNAALNLPPADRVQLVDSLLVSLHPNDHPFAAEWKKEIRRRIREFDKGKFKGVPWEEVKARGRASRASHG